MRISPHLAQELRTFRILTGVCLMDIELARTFLVVVETRNFVRAAEELHVTQSTVSARIRSLEDQLGRDLFIRNKAGVSLTSAGELFKRHAATLVHVWQHAKSEVEIPEGYSDVVSIGARFGLWNPILLRWLAWMREHHPMIAIQAELGMSDTITKRLADGTLDIAVIYSALNLPALKAEPLFLERLLLVSTKPKEKKVLPDNYIHVDWGADFQQKFRLAFPDQLGHGLKINLGVLGLSFIKENDGAAYFPERLVREEIEECTLHVVLEAPVITFPAFLVYPTDNGDPSISTAIDSLKRVTKEEFDQDHLLSARSRE